MLQILVNKLFKLLIEMFCLVTSWHLDKKTTTELRPTLIKTLSDLLLTSPTIRTTLISRLVSVGPKELCSVT